MDEYEVSRKYVVVDPNDMEVEKEHAPEASISGEEYISPTLVT